LAIWRFGDLVIDPSRDREEAVPRQGTQVLREGTLLQRLSKAGGRRSGRVQPTAAEDVEALMESVRQHLTRLLNSRHGMCECLPDYGLPALNDLTVGKADHVRAVEEALRTTIEKYEPRLRRVKVTRITEEDHGRSLSFRVEATLVGKSGEHRVWYETAVRGHGEFDVLG
jgi:type VI secretion system protein